MLEQRLVGSCDPITEPRPCMRNAKSSFLDDLFRKFHLPLRRFLLRRRPGSAADIEDIAQEVFLRLLRYDRSELIHSPQAYIYKIAANVSAEWATRASRSLPHSAEWLEELVDAFGPETQFEGQSAEAELHRVINILPPRSREIVRLHFGEGMTNEDIATRLGLTRRIVKRDLARAFATMRAALDAELAQLPWSNVGSGRQW